VTFAEGYPWLQALHVASALMFVGGVLAVSVFLTAASVAPPAGNAMAQAVRRWDHLVTAPAMLLVWALGLTLAVGGDRFSEPWLQAKLVFVVLLSGVHGVQSGRLRRLAGGGGSPPQRTSPLILASIVVIAVLAVVKPG
jgi:uncharacterized membrane protein